LELSLIFVFFPLGSSHVTVWPGDCSRH